ncbi:hypothetical protein FHL15_006924 [Xylaria flabelliformis]|uniref:Uncharacterized protein n=1 Tax=Xylaria flabelliformis TaxID=2512241 RepID=A0A553HWH7_9PEZI|nr:hypothetical protein FHL15_006924 [Xylaria flabelliformis]
MGAHAAAKLPFSAKKMRRQAPTAKMLRQQALVNEGGDTLDFVKVLKLMNEKHIASDISAFLRKSRVDGSNKWTCGPQENVKLNIADIINHSVSGDNEPGSKRASPSSVRGEEPQDQVSEIRISESQSVAGSWHTVTEAEKEQDDSDAISDTSFTPPKHLARYARYDDEGRRHMLPPPGFGDAAPKQQKQSRFVHGDAKGREHLMPPPGFRGAHPKLIDESPVALTFERKDFKKESEKRQVTHSGISLAMTRKQSSRSEGKKNKRSLDVSAGCSSVSKKEQSASLKKPTESPATDHLIGGWESALLKGVFDAEEDLLYGSRWPASTF